MYSNTVCVKLHSVCVKLHTVCEITQCAQNYTYSIEKIPLSGQRGRLISAVLLFDFVLGLTLRLHSSECYSIQKSDSLLSKWIKYVIAMLVDIQ